MDNGVNAWALVLAAGEGKRLRSLTTTPSGTVVPKQFCSLRDGPSLLHEALQRARAVSSAARTCVVVAEQHRQWWATQLRLLPPANIIVQPQNCGTANGILLPLLHIAARDADAHLVVLPSDHHIREESVLARSLRRAVEQLPWRSDEVVLMGIGPEGLDPEFGYIISGRGDARGLLEVEQFVEKPAPAQARELMQRGALWNAFIIVSTAPALLALFQQRTPQILADMREAVRHDLRSPTSAGATAELYRRLPQIDFSRDILPGQERHLRVLPVPPCGWSDLGTPEHVARALRQAPAGERSPAEPWSRGLLSLDLQYERWRASAG